MILNYIQQLFYSGTTRYMPYRFLILLLLPGCSIIQEQPSDIVTATKSRLLKLDYEGFTVWLDCSKRGAVKFRYNAQHDTGSFKRSSRFYLDPNVPSDCQQTSTKGYCNGPPEQPFILFNYSPTRSQTVADQLLQGFQGILQTDVYLGYSTPCTKNSLRHPGCRLDRGVSTPDPHKPGRAGLPSR